MIGHFESLEVIMSSPHAKIVNKPVLSLKNTLAIWCETLDLLAATFLCVYTRRQPSYSDFCSCTVN